jgi:hypothetical protein
VPTIFKAVAAQVTFSGRLPERFAARGAEWFLQQADILPAYCTIGNLRAALQTSGTGQARQRENGFPNGL